MGSEESTAATAVFTEVADFQAVAPLSLVGEINKWNDFVAGTKKDLWELWVGAFNIRPPKEPTFRDVEVNIPTKNYSEFLEKNPFSGYGGGGQMVKKVDDDDIQESYPIFSIPLILQFVFKIKPLLVCIGAFHPMLACSFGHPLIFFFLEDRGCSDQLTHTSTNFMGL